MGSLDRGVLNDKARNVVHPQESTGFATRPINPLGVRQSAYLSTEPSEQGAREYHARVACRRHSNRGNQAALVLVVAVTSCFFHDRDDYCEILHLPKFRHIRP